MIDSPLGVPTALHFGDPAAEHRAVRAGAGVIDLPHLGSICVTGADRVEFLHRMVTSDVKALAPGDSQPSAFLTTKGKFVAVFDLIAENDVFLAVTTRDELGALLADLTKYAILDDVEFTDESLCRRSLHIAGPDSGRAVALIRDTGLTILEKNRTGDPGFDMHCAPDEVEPIWCALVDAGIAPVGHVAHETLRIEAGIPRADAELTSDTGPLETGMPELVSLTKGCYRGQEVVAKMHYIGKPPKRIVGLGFDDAEAALPAPGDAILNDGRSVGRVTSVAYIPTLERPVALGLVRAKVVEGGAPVTCETDGGLVVMRFEETPFL